MVAASHVGPSEFQLIKVRGTRLAQLVRSATPDFGSGHDLTVCEFELCLRLCAYSVEPAWDSLFPSLSAPSLLMHILSLSLSVKINFKN